MRSLSPSYRRSGAPRPSRWQVRIIPESAFADIALPVWPVHPPSSSGSGPHLTLCLLPSTLPCHNSRRRRRDRVTGHGRGARRAAAADPGRQPRQGLRRAERRRHHDIHEVREGWRPATARSALARKGRRARTTRGHYAEERRPPPPIWGSVLMLLRVSSCSPGRMTLPSSPSAPATACHVTRYAPQILSASVGPDGHG